MDTILLEDFGMDFARPYPEEMNKLFNKYVLKKYLLRNEGVNQTKRNIDQAQKILQGTQLFNKFHTEISKNRELIKDNAKLNNMFTLVVNHIVKYEFTNFRVSLSIDNSLIVRFETENYHIELELFFLDSDDGIETIATYKNQEFRPIKEYGLHSEILDSMDRKIIYPILVDGLYKDNIHTETNVSESDYAQTA